MRRNDAGPPREPSRPVLRWQAGGRTEEFALSNVRPTTIGRDAKCTIAIDSRQVSKQIPDVGADAEILGLAAVDADRRAQSRGSSARAAVVIVKKLSTRHPAMRMSAPFRLE